MKILLVDDDEMILKALTKKIKDWGYEVFAVNNSIEALALIGKQKIDLIISDIVMPALSGFTLLSMLKNFYYLKVPVILISSFDQDDVVTRSRSLGANDFISKPIDFGQLLVKIQKLIGIKP